MPTNQQRREAERRRLQRQLEERRAREIARRRFTLITSIVSTVAVIAIIVTIIIVVSSRSSGTKTPAASARTSTVTSPSSSPSPSPTGATSPATALKAPMACAGPSKGVATYRGVTVAKATNLAVEPTVTSKGAGTPDSLACQDLVLGAGKAAKPTSTITIQYTGVLYSNGVKFDSSRLHGKSATFSLTQVVPGFTQGIAGTGKVAPMKVGGRRVLILPPALGYGATAQGKIPANSTLVFVVDLLKVA